MEYLAKVRELEGQVQGLKAERNVGRLESKLTLLEQEVVDLKNENKQRAKGE